MNRFVIAWTPLAADLVLAVVSVGPSRNGPTAEKWPERADDDGRVSQSISQYQVEFESPSCAASRSHSPDPLLSIITTTPLIHDSLHQPIR